MHFEINIVEDNKENVLDDKEETIDYDEPDDENTLPHIEDGGEIDEDNQADTQVMSNEDTTTAKMNIPNTGEKSFLIFIVIFFIAATIMYIKFKNISM